MDVVTFAEASADLKGVMDRVAEGQTHVVIARDTAEAVVMVSLFEWNSMAEAMQLLASPVNAEGLFRWNAAIAAAKGDEREVA